MVIVIHTCLPIKRHRFLWETKILIMLWDHTSTAKACFKKVMQKFITGTSNRILVIVNQDKMVMIYQHRINRCHRRINSQFSEEGIDKSDKYHSKEIIPIEIKFQVFHQEASSPWTAPTSTQYLLPTINRGISNMRPKLYSLQSNSTWPNLFWMHLLSLTTHFITIKIP